MMELLQNATDRAIAFKVLQGTRWVQIDLGPGGTITTEFTQFDALGKRLVALGELKVLAGDLGNVAATDPSRTPPAELVLRSLRGLLAEAAQLKATVEAAGAVAVNAANAAAGYRAKIEVGTIAALKLLGTSNYVAGDVAKVRGFAADADGGEGDFVWTPASADTEDTGFTVAPSAGSGRWKRLFRKGGVVRAEWFGCKGDGVTNNTAALQLAYNTVSAAGGGTIRFGAGTFRFNTAVHTRSYVTLEGESRRTTIFKQPLGVLNTAIIEAGDELWNETTAPTRYQFDLGFENIGFDLTNNVSAKGIRLRYPVRGVRVENCDCFQSAIEEGGVSSGNGDRHFIDMSMSGRFVDKTYGVEDLWVKGCRVSGRVQLTSNAGNGIRSVFIIGNKIDDPVAYGVAITSIGQLRSYSIENVVIQGNSFTNTANAILIGRDPNPGAIINFTEGAIHRLSGIVIADNIIRLPSNSGAASAISVGVYQTSAENVTIVGNTIETDATDTHQRVGIQLSAFDHNWMSMKHGGGEADINTAPTFNSAGVDTSTDTITTPTEHYLVSGMVVRFSPVTPGTDILPSPLVAHRRYRVVGVSATQFKLQCFRSGATVNLTTVGTGSFRYLFAPTISSFRIERNIVRGVENAVRLLCGVGGVVANNLIYRGSLILDSNSTIEEVEIRENTFLAGGLRLIGSAVDCTLQSNLVSLHDDQFGVSLDAFNFSPSSLLNSQSWRVVRNVVRSQRLDGAVATRIRHGFSDTDAVGQVLNDYIENEASGVVGNGFNLTETRIGQWVGNRGTRNLSLLAQRPRRQVTATAVLDFNLTSVSEEDLTIAVTGATLNSSFVQLRTQLAWPAGVGFTAFVSATNTVTVRAFRTAGIAVNPGSQSFTVMVDLY